MSFESVPTTVPSQGTSGLKRKNAGTQPSQRPALDGAAGGQPQSEITLCPFFESNDIDT